MINYTWKIHSITKKTVNNIDSVVFAVVWEKFGLSDDGYSGSIKSSANFNIDDIDENSFVPYNQLIEEVVVSWIKSFIDEENINKLIEKEIEKSRSNSIQVDDGNLPWQVVGE